MSGKTRSRRGPTRTESRSAARPATGATATDATATSKVRATATRPAKKEGASTSKGGARARGGTSKIRIGRRGHTAQPEAKGRRPSGRYTPPIPKSVKRSPRWYPWVLLGLLLVGVLSIILNYIQVLPASPTNWYVVGGLIAILVAALMATSYR
jgi:hypothetical protein